MITRMQPIQESFWDNRIMAVRITFSKDSPWEQQSLIIVGAYIQPGDKASSLANLEFFIKSLKLANPTENFYVLGDFNMDLERNRRMGQQARP